MTDFIKDNPEYVQINNEEQSKELRLVLRTPAGQVEFPLSEEDQRYLGILETKFDNEENMAGLAAPQIGIPRRMIVFACPDDAEMKKFREDLVQFMPKTIWLNPIYEGIGEDKRIDNEGCFSVYDLAGPVPRFKKIKYTAQLTDGSLIEGEAEGFLARIIQHEVDHLNGILFIDLAKEDELISIKEYQEKRAQALREAMDKG